ncbi:MAG TPA: hypothetical protein V6D05_17805 [Stenomitos sp.]
MTRLNSMLGLCLALFLCPAACSRQAPPVPEQPAPPVQSNQAPERPEVARCSFGRVPPADERSITAAIQSTFRPSPDNTYDVIGVYYTEPAHGPSYAFLAVLRVVGIAGPRVALFDQVTGTFDGRTRQVSGLSRSTYDPSRCPEISTASAQP